MKLFAIVLIGVVSFMARPTTEAHQFFKLDRPEAVSVAQVEQQTTPETKPLIQAEKAPESKPAEIPPQPPPQPASCREDQWVRADNGQCLDKPKYTAPVIASSGYSAGVGSGSCEAEISKYGWDYGTAVAVARAESGLNPGIVNNNPNTRDYSIGCFQINIYGANARTRPSEAALKDAATNVAYAWKIYTGNGNSFIGQWGVCGYKVRCY